MQADQENGSGEQVEALCRLSHDAYEKAAVGSGWQTNPVSRVAWADVPEANKVAMRASVAAVAAAVRAEAVAGALNSAADDLYSDSGPGNMLSTATWLRARAAGSVPTANPQPPAGRDERGRCRCDTCISSPIWTGHTICRCELCEFARQAPVATPPAEPAPRSVAVIEAHLADDCPDRDHCWARDIHDEHSPRLKDQS